jgi:DNA invertase Pin-like site-specific DNA recombinase
VSKKKSSAPRPLLGGLLRRLPQCVHRGIALLIRVSRPEQLKNIGSLTWQYEQIGFLKQYGIDPENEKVEVYAGAESAKGTQFRPVFDRLLHDAGIGTVGVVVVADVDRNARNERDSEALYNALAEGGGIVAERNQLYDPRDHSHRLMLRIRSAIAEYDNDNRTLKLSTGRCALARDMKYAIPLPTGLIWADADSPTYVEALTRAGLADAVSERQLHLNRTGVVRKERVLRVLPYPDADVHAACTLALQWIIETRDLTEVLRRIADHPEWPRPGEFPVCRQSVIQLDSAEEEIPPVRWQRVVNVADGREELGRARVFNWIVRPALYGIYRHNSVALADSLPDGIPAVVWQEDAFPAFMPSSYHERVRAIVKTKHRYDRIGSVDIPRRHALPRVVCVEPLVGGRTCDRVMSVTYPSANTAGAHYGYFYKTQICNVRGHDWKLPQAADEVVLDAVLGLFRPEVLRAELTRVERKEGVAAQRQKKLAADVEELLAKAEWAEDKAFKASSAKQAKREAHWLEKNDEYRDAADRKAAELRLLESRADSEERITATEYTKVMQLAEDLPQLFGRCREHDFLTAALMSEIIAEVRARRVGQAVYSLDIVLHSGAVLHELVSTRSTLASQPLVMFARTKLGPWADTRRRSDHETDLEAQRVANAVADEINGILEGRMRHRWTAMRVFSAVLTNDSAPGPLPGAMLLTEFSTSRGLEESVVLRELLAGKLGNGDLRNEEWWIAPELKQVHRAFPQVALRDVAAELGAAEAHVVLVADMARESGTTPMSLWHKLARSGAKPVKDACGRAYSTLSVCRSVLGL